MNIEFIKLSDGTTAITDNNGKISKIKMETSSEELLVKNKIEILDESINETKKKVKDYKGLAFLSKHMLIFQPICGAAITLLGYVLGNLSGLITALSSSILVCGVEAIMWGIVYPVAKRKLKGYEGKLEKSLELIKLEHEKELELERDKEKKLTLQKEKVSINEPISLIKQNEFEILSIRKQLEIAYSDAIGSKSKKLVLERNSSKRR